MLTTIVSQLAVFLVAVGVCSAGFLAASAICRMTPGGLAHGLEEFRSYFASEPDDFAAQRRARQFTSVMSSSGMIALVNIVNVLVLAIMLAGETGDINILWWGGAICLMAGFQVDSCMKMRGKTVSLDRANVIIRRIIRNVTVFGAAWGAGATLFLSQLAAPYDMMLILALLGTAAGGVAALGALPPAAILFASAIGAPVICKFLETGATPYFAIAGYASVLLFTFGAVSAGVYGANVKRPALAALGRERECAGVGCVVPGAVEKRRKRPANAGAAGLETA